MGSELSLYRIKILKEKNESNGLIRDITFKMILTGLATQRVYKIILDKSELHFWFYNKKLWNNNDYL